MDLKDLLKVIRYRWISIVSIILVCVIIAFGWTKIQKPVYTANANGLVTTASNSSTSNQSVSIDYAANSLIEAKLPSYLELGSLRSVAQYAIDQLNLDTTPESLINQVAVSNPANTTFIQVKAEGSTPEAARDLAEVWIRGIVREVNLMETGNADTPGSIYLAPKDVANLPKSPSSPNLQLNLAVGLLGGLILALAYALIRHFLDRKIRSVEDVEQKVGASVIGTVPFEKTLTHDDRLFIKENTDNSSDSAFALSEALRTLRTNIQFIDVDNPPTAIVVTSPLPGDGKSTIAANLALSIAMNGRRTILIDADLRRPMQSTIFGIPSGAGLTDLLADKASLDDVAHMVSDNGNLAFIPAGSTPPNPSEILGSARMQKLINELRQEAFVIIDAPPVIPVTDAAVLSTEADGALVVATVGKTTHDILAKALDNLQKVNGRALGIVLNRVPTKGMGAAYYGYQYKDRYYRSDSNQAKKN